MLMWLMIHLWLDWDSIVLLLQLIAKLKAGEKVEEEEA